MTKAEALHHECNMSERLTKLERFCAAIRDAFAELEGRSCELSLDECSMKRLEELGRIALRRE